MLQRISINHDFYRRDPTRPYYEESVEDYGFVIRGNLSMAYNEYNMVQWVGTMGESIYHRLLKNNQKGTRRYSRFGCAAKLSQQLPLSIFHCPRKKTRNIKIENSVENENESIRVQNVK
jgi:hypothetical protein